ncbi:hypothetical protein TNCT_163761 [Trichonephila clavata]|uniref:Uncharacterized protein n=1 Tax=Trichonephila clavata TaxID=2740835 RepID=A0A8X6GF88_TRICU|nr:hypothetical protein TNCT_571671 [Trichonephila clavata]GFR02803.1 hypothetical protein TNCT_163761 [Trichonephila clavata]
MVSPEFCIESFHSPVNIVRHEKKFSPTQRHDRVEGSCLDRNACIRSQIRLAQNSFPNPSTARCTSCFGGTNAQLTRRQALMVGYWVNPPTSFKMQGRLVQNCALNPSTVR